MKKLTLLLAGVVLFALPHAANAAEQCTTGTLDLVCDEGEVLRGISSSGQKICISESTGGGGFNVDIPLYRCPSISPASTEGGRNGSIIAHDNLGSGCVGQVSTAQTCLTYSANSSGGFGSGISVESHAHECMPIYVPKIAAPTISGPDAQQCVTVTSNPQSSLSFTDQTVIPVHCPASYSLDSWGYQCDSNLNENSSLILSFGLLMQSREALGDSISFAENPPGFKSSKGFAAPACMNATRQSNDSNTAFYNATRQSNDSNSSFYYEGKDFTENPWVKCCPQ